MNEVSLLERIAVALERMADTQDKLLTGGNPAYEKVYSEPGTPAAPEKETPAPKTKATKAKAETPAPKAEGPTVTCDDLRAVFSAATKKDNPGARKLFAEYREEVGIQEIEKMSDAQRGDLKARLEAFIAGETEAEPEM